VLTTVLIKNNIKRCLFICCFFIQTFEFSIIWKCCCCSWKKRTNETCYSISGNELNVSIHHRLTESCGNAYIPFHETTVKVNSNISGPKPTFEFSGGSYLSWIQRWENFMKLSGNGEKLKIDLFIYSFNECLSITCKTVKLIGNLLLNKKVGLSSHWI
jgi:hypothetical protein